MLPALLGLLGGGGAAAGGGGMMSLLTKMFGGGGLASGLGPFGGSGGGNPIMAAFNAGPPSGTAATGWMAPSGGGDRVAQGAPFGRGNFGNQVPGQQGGSYGSLYSASAPTPTPGSGANTAGGGFIGPGGGNVGAGGTGPATPPTSMKDKIMQEFMKNLFGGLGKPVQPGRYTPAQFSRPAMQNQAGY